MILACLYPLVTTLVLLAGSNDCNGNGIDDGTDIGNGTSQDCDGNGVPDECQTDTDGDGAIDPCDGCPNDPNKTGPGICGCGTPDTDSDGDGLPDCDGGGDKCPFDPNKTAPGICGCGIPDTDTDVDGVADCMDNCIAIPNPAQQDCDGDFDGDVCEIAAGAPDRNGDGIPDSCQVVGDPYCFGDGSPVPCPCGNAGPAGSGCANSIGGAARLEAVGTIHPDDLVLVSSGELASALTIFAQGTQFTIPAHLFGDGLRCVGGSIKRLYVKHASAGIAYAPHASDLSITERSAALGDPIPSPGFRYYWAYYRDPSPAFCTAATFNASNAVAVTWY